MMNKSKRSHLFIVHMKCLTKYDQVVNHISLHFVDGVRKIKISIWELNFKTKLNESNSSVLKI
jgi:hypothetical protein